MNANQVRVMEAGGNATTDAIQLINGVIKNRIEENIQRTEKNTQVIITNKLGKGDIYLDLPAGDQVWQSLMDDYYSRHFDVLSMRDNEEVIGFRIWW